MSPLSFRRLSAIALWALAVSAFAPVVLAQVPGGGSASTSIHSCVDSKGRRLTSDRPIAECQDREQRVLNNDGTMRKTLPPAMSPAERAEQEAKEQQEAQALAAKQEASRRERNLLMRYPNQAKHDAARNLALDDLRDAMISTKRRLAALREERQPLAQEEAASAGKALPLRLRQQINANDAATQAQNDLLQAQQSDLLRVTARYDDELALLKRLWAGEAPGAASYKAGAGK